jgi:hypothetical protein
MIRILFASLIIIATCAAQAQITLPTAQLPRLPPVQLPVDVDKTLSNVTANLDTRQLVELRLLHVHDLIRTHRDVIEADPHGAPIVRAELLAFSPSDAAIESARAAGFAVVRERVLEGLDAQIVVFHAPSGMSTQRALQRLKALDPDGTYDFNHIYTDSGAVSSPEPLTPHPDDRVADQAVRKNAQIKIGLIDGGVDAQHPVFHDTAIHQHGCVGHPVVSAHGTAVASLLVGRSGKVHGAAPGAELYAADVYCGLPTGGAVDAVADAVAWMAREHVPTINVSLVGPPNVMLENIIRLTLARGHIVVAAVGNDGPTAPPLYPAAYPDVVGVTAVDVRRRVLVEAERGPQVVFAAPGADMVAASNSQTYAAVRGTSFAAPIVAGLLAVEMHEPERSLANRAVTQLAKQAIDLGPPGRDPIYGYGLVGEALRVEPSVMNLHEK